MKEQEKGSIQIETSTDIVRVRRKVREIATTLGFSITDVARIVTAASELARNIVQFAGSGVMQWTILRRNELIGIQLIFVDKGPGIPDVELAMREGYSSGNGLGMGLPGVKKLMDEMEVKSKIGKGTKIKIIKWLRK
jgi:serine/threonine-protein kinase RsbT